MPSSTTSEGKTDSEELVKHIYGRTVNRIGKDILVSALSGIITAADIDTIRQLREEVELAQRHKDECQAKMDKICKQYFPKQYANLLSPGLDSSRVMRRVPEKSSQGE